MVHDLSLSNSIINQFVAELRDVTIQSDIMRFRRNLERIGEIFAYEISKTFSFELKDVTTPLGMTLLTTTEQQYTSGLSKGVFFEYYFTAHYAGMTP